MPIRPDFPNQYRLLQRTVVACLMLGLILWTVWPWLPSQKSSRPQTIVLYGFSILEEAITKNIFPAFQKKWMSETGQHVELVGSFAGSGTVTNQLIMGVPAELAILSTELDALRLKKAGVVRTETWKELPHKGVINRTPFVIAVRPGNPKKIHDFSDLARPGIRIVHPDPLTSGAANWSIVAEYGAAAREPGAGPNAGRSLLLGIWRNVAIQSGSARAAKTQFDQGFGDALITNHKPAYVASKIFTQLKIFSWPKQTPVIAYCRLNFLFIEDMVMPCELNEQVWLISQLRHLEDAKSYPTY